MHELSLAADVVEQICQAARQENAVRVSRVVMAIGAFSGVERDAFEFVFPFAAENTMAEGADIVVEEVPAKAVCGLCGCEFLPDLAFMLCPKCGTDNITLQGGREFLIRSVELQLP